MERTRLAIGAWTAPVVQAVGRVRVLLDLRHHQTREQRVHCARRHMNRVVRADGDALQDLFDAAFGQGTTQGLPGRAGTQAIDNLGSRIGVENVPHLRLAEVPFMGQCVSIIGMHLYRQVAVGIEQFHK